MKLWHAILGGLLLAGTSTVALAQQNSVYTGATRITIDNDWVNTYINSTYPQRWYRMGLVQYRSYCVITTPGEGQVDVTTTDTITEIYNDPTGALTFYNDDNYAEPISGYYSRNCFIWTLPNSTEVYLKVRIFGGAPASAQYLRFKVVETTIYGAWFFTDATYAGFIEVKNTTNSTVNTRITLRGQNTGAVLGTPLSVNVPGYGNVLYNARSDFGGTLAAGGSVEISHNGAPGAISGNITTLSATTGLSFDAPMARRTQ